MGLNHSLDIVPAWPQTDPQQERGRSPELILIRLTKPMLSMSFDTPWKLFLTFQFTDILEIKLRAFTSYLTKINQFPIKLLNLKIKF